MINQSLIAVNLDVQMWSRQRLTSREEDGAALKGVLLGLLVEIIPLKKCFSAALKDWRQLEA